ncbi:hypothetical protein ACPCSP_27965 [Streptomyces cinereoruber]|uniref:hypothetical protein n=1 Tax=Streptomyces cinereoruber TaxID=67260 RepID=UPI003C2E38DF
MLKTDWEERVKAQEARVSIELVEHPTYYPEEAWDLDLDLLDMVTEEVMEELAAISWAEGKKYPNFNAVSAKTSQLNWGASGSFTEILMQVSVGAAGGAGGTAIHAAIKLVYEKLKSRSQGESWSNIPSADEAARLAKSRLHQHYGVAADKLRVTGSNVDADAERYEIDFVHEDGRKFGAIVGAVKGIPSCTVVRMESGEPVLRPLPDTQSQGD